MFWIDEFCLIKDVCVYCCIFVMVNLWQNENVTKCYKMFRFVPGVTIGFSCSCLVINRFCHKMFRMHLKVSRNISKQNISLISKE